MHSITIGSKFEEMTEVESLIDKVCAELKWGDENYGNVLIAVTEAVNNAIIHGNESNAGKKIKVDVKREKNAVIFSVSDEGQGFDYQSVPDPTAPENLEKPDGRGIFLMKSLSDGVVFENGGSKVSIAFSAQ
jgi:serine/threonine-protein kinase RsbW